MIVATQKDKERIIDIIATSFDTNKSINYVVKQDDKRRERLRSLIEYSIFQGEKFGKVVMSEDRNAACIILHPWQKKVTLSSILWDLRLITNVIGVRNVGRVLTREKLLKKNYPKTPFYHLWYIGVDPKYQNRGIGSKLLREVLESCNDKPIYLETSVVSNLDWYAKHNFEIMDTLELGYTLYVLRKK